ncbi:MULTISPECIES: hypothetical protein [unclassified Apibacter]|uniref:tetratricopeptide repeat protein n=1 Tax=unclassified Apibacter TaxID=2630820 RepID=UPI0013216992|nr:MULTISPECIES: hypothetical protein [unclassified Apibacter]MCX8677084.1 hypothetical protein [Apibacter sp. B3919]MXO24536.1 hypothetical protein [Apibacter sp. B3924]MXO25780.1 hypothetical protein [Apibacter sp. B3813]MXO27731.1 hypothetical protein [Apibacter sp. B3913]MXO29909.1 hypothetical protein [Apibacter sp. B3912]
MNYAKKEIGATFVISAMMLSGFMNAQSIQEGIKYLESDQYSKAKNTFEKLAAQSPSADNYYYLGAYYLSISKPDLEMASQYFNKGLALDPKSDLNKIGLATIKLYQGKKSEANAEFESIAKGSKYKNADVLFQISKAYQLFTNKPESTDYDKSIEYGQKLLDLVKNKDKSEYYIVLGNAYFEKKDPGKAVSNYTKALGIAADKSIPYALIGNIWGRTNGQGKLAAENFDKAIAANPNYPLTYKYLSDFNVRSGNYNEAFKNLQKYISLSGNNDAETQFELAKVSYFIKDYAKSLDLLTRNWNDISDPLKFKLKALDLIENSDFSEAYKNINQYLQTIPESKREGSDYGVLGKIQASLLKTANGQEKEELTKTAILNLTKAIGHGDKTYDYQSILLSLQPGAKTEASITNPKIEALKKSVAADAKDTTSWYNLALEQYEAKDYLGSVASWDQLISLIPTWEVAYAGKGMALYAYDSSDKSGLTAQAFQKYIDMVEPKKEYSANEKAYLAIAYTFFAYKEYHEGNKDKAETYLKKTLSVDPQNADALNLQKLLQ